MGDRKTGEKRFLEYDRPEEAGTSPPSQVRRPMQPPYKGHVHYYEPPEDDSLFLACDCGAVASMCLNCRNPTLYKQDAFCSEDCEQESGREVFYDALVTLWPTKIPERRLRGAMKPPRREVHYPEMDREPRLLMTSGPVPLNMAALLSRAQVLREWGFPEFANDYEDLARSLAAGETVRCLLGSRSQLEREREQWLDRNRLTISSV